MSSEDYGDVIGVDLGGTKITCGLVTAEGSVLYSETVPTPAAEGPRAVVELCARMISGTRERAASSGRLVRTVGVGAAGVIDSQSGTVTSATQAIPNWTGTEIRRDLQDALGLEVFVLNDVHAHAVGEAWVGAGRGFDSVLLVTVGTGVGGAYLHDGKVLSGAHGLAGHLGHIPSPEAAGVDCSCGAVGHLEGIASGPGLHAEFLRRGGDSEIADAKAVVGLLVSEPSLARSLAREVVTLAATAFGKAMGGLINVFDPHVIIVGGGLAEAGSEWWDVVRTAAESEVLIPIKNYIVTPPELGGNSAVIGAARFAATSRS